MDKTLVTTPIYFHFNACYLQSYLSVSEVFNIILNSKALTLFDISLNDVRNE